MWPDVGQTRAACQFHGHLQFGAQGLQHACHPGLAAAAQRPGPRPADKAGAGPLGKAPQNVGAIADAAGPGLVTIRQMQKRPEYTRGFAGAVVVAAATLGPIIPPSIPMVIYALVSGASVGALFLGGVLPGALMALIERRVSEVRAGAYPKLR